MWFFANNRLNYNHQHHHHVDGDYDFDYRLHCLLFVDVHLKCWNDYWPVVHGLVLKLIVDFENHAVDKLDLCAVVAHQLYATFDVPNSKLNDLLDDRANVMLNLNFAMTFLWLSYPIVEGIYLQFCFVFLSFSLLAKATTVRTKDLIFLCVPMNNSLKSNPEMEKQIIQKIFYFI